MFRGSPSTLLTLGLFSLDSSMAAIDVGGSHACTTVGESLKCWGANKWGQLGRGDRNMTGDDPDEMGDKLIKVNLGTGEVAVDMALGEEHTCVMLDSGGTKCFGQNNNGQLGLGDTEIRGILPSELGDDLPEVDFGTGLTATAITTGCSHTCGLLDDGSVKCFGYNNYGQLGQGSTDNVGDEAGHMGDDLPAVPLGGASAVAIAAGCDFTCAITEDGAVMCWGRNTWGQLGTGDSEDRLDDPGETLVAVDLDGSSATAIAAGGTHVCVLNQDKSIKCWGRNNRGQLGLGDDIDRGEDATLLGANLTAVSLGNGDIPVAIDGGSLHTCVLLQEGAIKCFGGNDDGELGIGSTVDIGMLPMDMGDNLVAVDLGDTASEFAVGGSSACAVLSDKSIKCWGRGNSGQLGQGDDENVGGVAGVLAELPPVDVGTDASITPAPSSPVTAAPSVASSSPSTVPSTPVTTPPSTAPSVSSASSVSSSTPPSAPTTPVTTPPSTAPSVSSITSDDSFTPSSPSAAPTTPVTIVQSTAPSLTSSAPSVTSSSASVTSSAPSSAPLATATTDPTGAPSAASRQIDVTETLAPGATAAPTVSNQTASPTIEADTRSNSASGTHFSGGLLATAVLGAAGVIGMFLP